MQTRRFAPLALLLAMPLTALVAACNPHFPADTRGRVAGRVFYSGEAHRMMARPILTIALFSQFPPVGPPYGSLTLERPEFGAEGIAYELYGLPRAEGTYLLAELRDEATGERGPVAGAYPNYCALSLAKGAVSLTSTATLEGADITLYGAAGALDPCSKAQVGECPDPGRASLVLTVDAHPPEIGPMDALIFGLFPSWPPVGPPSKFGRAPSQGLEFPHRFVDPGVPPGRLALYACFDRGGNNTTQLCDPREDLLQVVSGGATIEFAADTITEIRLDLGTGSSTISPARPAGEVCANRPDAGAPSDAGTPPDGGSSPDAGTSGDGGSSHPTTGTLTLRILSSQLVEAGDTVVGALFSDFPPSGPPIAYETAPARGFPQTVVIENITPGSHFPYACFDKGGNNLMCNGPGDRSAGYPSAPLSITGGAELSIDINL